MNKTFTIIAFTCDEPLINSQKIKCVGKNGFYFAEGDKKEIDILLNENINSKFIEYILSKNQLVDLISYNDIDARIEPGAVIRKGVNIKKGAVILMNAVVNVGAVIGENTMVDMGAVIGSKAKIGNNCHIGANAVIAGVLEPVSKKEVKIGNNCFIGANAVVLEGVKIGDGAIIGAMTLVNKDVPCNAVVMGVPGRVIKYVNENLKEKCKINENLRRTNTD